MERFAYIYALEYPEGNIRYIGKTVNLRKRLVLSGNMLIDYANID